MSDLPAGRELDALVAEKVMGEPRPIYTAGYEVLSRQLVGHPIQSSGRNWVELCEFERGDVPTWYPLPFSADIAAAWLVVEKWNADPDRCCNIAWNPTIATVEPYWSAAFWEKGMIARYIGNAPTAPLAICRAALAAVGAA